MCPRTQGQKGQLGGGPESNEDWCIWPCLGSTSHTPAIAPLPSHTLRLRGHSFLFFSSHLPHFPLSAYRSAISASQPCSWRRLLLTCLSASSQERQTSVNPNSKFPQGEYGLPSSGQISTWSKFTLVEGWETAGSRKPGSGPAPWNGEPFSEGEGRLWRGQASPQIATGLHTQRVRRVSEFRVFYILEYGCVLHITTPLQSQKRLL